MASVTHPRRHRRCRWPIGILFTIVAVVAVTLTGIWPVPAAEAATITASYQFGHRNVLINDYGTQALGTFVLRTDSGDPEPGREHLALCIEAASGHSTATGAYRLVANRVSSPQLDYLLWKYGFPGHPEHVALAGDHDTATALAALAWYYAGATRRGGGLVWADWTRSFAPITPISPHSWHALPRFSLAHPVGLRANGVDLDAAERRVHDLYREAEARRGPWTMSPIRVAGSTASVTLTGPGGPIANLSGVHMMVRDASGHVVARRTIATDRQGVAQVSVPALPDGGTIVVSASSPGVHQEWDGDGSIQRMSTATGRKLERTVTVAPLPIHLRVVKQSSDPAFAVDGARFAVIDSSGAVAATASTGATGAATLAALDPSAHPGPYRIRELAAPAGLSKRPDDLHVAPPYSRDPSRPTEVTVVNDPVLRQVRVRKALSDPAVGPGDLSGFEFSITRGIDGRSFGPVVSLADGWTPPFDVTSGDYQICEDARPEWANHLIDPGCHSVTVSADHPEPIEVVYTNVVPVPSLRSRARDAADGDQMLASTGGTIVDTVMLVDLVPGTTYRLEGEFVAVHDDGASAATGIVATTDFTASSPAVDVEMRFDVPGDPGFAVGVITQRLMVDGVIVASHDDLDDREQTIWIPSASTRASVIDSEIAALGRIGDEMLDLVAYSGLVPGVYEAHLVWHRKATDGTCTPTTMTSTAVFETERHEGVVVVGPVTITGEADGSTLVAFQRIVRIDDSGGTDVPPVAIHHADCGDIAQTVWVPALTTQVSQPTTAAPALVHDTITVTGLPEILPAGWTARITGGVHRHDASSPTEHQVCHDANLTTRLDLEISGPGTFSTPGATHAAGRFSYAERIEISADGRTWTSSWHGCDAPDQTFTVVAQESFPGTLPPEVETTTPSAPSAPPTTPLGRPSLPRTGAVAMAVVTSFGLITCGAGGLALVGSARRKRRC
jgi:hypothetical protein